MGKRRLLVYLLIASGVLIAIAEGVLGNVITTQLPVDLRPYTTQLLIGVTLAAIVVAELLYRAQEVTNSYQRRLRRRDRKRFLSRLHSRYIRRRNASLRGIKQLALSIREEPDAVVVSSSIYRFVQSQEHQTIHAWNTANVTDAFEFAEKALLVLGEPGAGKTMLLLDIASSLVETAQKNDALPMPVILSLASWAIRRPPIHEWMVDELTAIYQVPRELAAIWVESEEVMPIFDGLDEVDRAHRPACVEAINVYHRAHGLVPMLVSSRTADYVSQKSRLEIGTAVVVEPLSHEQLDDFLANLGERSAGLRDAMRLQSNLRDLLAIPLLLNLALLTYEDAQASDIPAVGSGTAWRDRLFWNYVNKMLYRPDAPAPRYPQSQLAAWLGWLAQQMTQRGIAELYLEDLQPTWLPKRTDRNWFRIITYIIVFLASTAVNTTAVWAFLDPQRAVVFGILLAPAALLFIGIPRGNSIQFDGTTAWSWVSALAGAIVGFLTGLGFGLGIGIGSGLGLNGFGLAVSLTIGMLATTLFGWYLLPSDERVFLIVVSVFAFVTGAVFILLGLSPEQLYSGLGEGLIPGAVYSLGPALMYATVLGTISGLSGIELDTHDLASPGEGIRRSAKNSALVAFIIAAVYALMLLVIAPLGTRLVGSLLAGQSSQIPSILGSIVQNPVAWLSYRTLLRTPVLVSIAIYYVLLRGGLAVIQHAILRIQLRIRRLVPSNLPRFLQYCADCALLQSSGGGYRFFHPLFQAFCAEQFVSLTLEGSTAAVGSVIVTVPPAANYWNQKGLQSLQLSHYEEALAAFEEALRLVPGDARCWSNKATVYLYVNRFEEALSSCRRAVELDPKLADAWQLKGIVLEFLQQPTEALAAYDQALEIDPHEGRFWRSKAEVLIEHLERFEEGYAAATHATQLDPQSVRGWVLVGCALLGKGLRAEAEEDFRRAAQLPANNSLDWDYRGLAIAYMGRWQEALGAVEQGLSLLSDGDADAENLFLHKGAILAVLGHNTEAIAAFDRANSLNPRAVAELYLKAATLRTGRLDVEDREAEDLASSRGKPDFTTRFFIAQIERRGTATPVLSTPEISPLSNSTPFSPSTDDEEQRSVVASHHSDGITMRSGAGKLHSRSGYMFARLVTVVLVVVLALAGSGFIFFKIHSLEGVTVSTFYSDPLNGSGNNNWPEGNQCFFKNGGYHINASVICYAPTIEVGDAVTTVSVKQISGPITYGYGLVIRRVSKGNFYEFGIDSNGKWYFDKVVNGTRTAIIPYTANSAIKWGLNQENTIAVSARGSHFSFSINGVRVGFADDTTFTSGETGLTGNFGIEVVFTHISIANEIG